MGILKILVYIVIAVFVFSLVSTYIISINAPEVAGLIGQSITSFFKGPSANNTFISKNINFSYPGNWLVFSPSVVNGIPILSQNITISKSISNNIENSSIALIMPNSYFVNIVEDIPSVISGAISKNLSLGSITSLIKNVNLIAVSDFPLPKNLSNTSNLNQIGSYLKAFNINSLNNSRVNISGYTGFLITDTDITIPQIGNTSFDYAKIAIAITGKTICMVFALSSQNHSNNVVQTAFDRVIKTLKCKSKV